MKFVKIFHCQNKPVYSNVLVIIINNVNNYVVIGSIVYAY